VTGSPARVCAFFIQREMVALATGSLSSPDWRAVQGGGALRGWGGSNEHHLHAGRTSRARDTAGGRVPPQAHRGGDQKETQEERKKSQQLGQELERMRLEHGPGGITGLFASGLMTVDEQGVKAEDITKGITRPASNALVLRRVLSYRVTTRQENVLRVAVAMKLVNQGTQPWTLQGAALVGKGQEPKPVKVSWQPSPIPPGIEPGVVVVEWDLTAREARGSFTLKL
jgi:hypothetical protein